MSTLQHLAEKELVKPPRWLPANVMFETIMGSVAYGVSGDTSDMVLVYMVAFTYGIFGFSELAQDSL